MKKIVSFFVISFICAYLSICSVRQDYCHILYAADTGASCLNDVGDGAFIWGTADEQTTYIGPYSAFMAPKIANMSDLQTKSSTKSDESVLSTSKVEAVDVNEVGTIFGIDGNLYQYHYVQGVEPRRVIEIKKVPVATADGKGTVMVDRKVERIVMEPVLVRVLSPVNRAKGEKKQDSNSVASQTSNQIASMASSEANPPAESPTDSSSVAPCAPTEAIPPCSPTANLSDDKDSSAYPKGIPEGAIVIKATIRAASPENNDKPKPILVLPEAARPRPKTTK